MSGICRHTGKIIDDLAMIEQSIDDIMQTVRGSRLLMRGYGTKLMDLVDNPVDKMALIYETADAIIRNEPRVTLKKVDVSYVGRGQVAVTAEFVFSGKNYKYGVALK